MSFIDQYSRSQLQNTASSFGNPFNYPQSFRPEQAIAFLKIYRSQHNIILLGAELLVAIGVAFAWISLLPYHSI